MGMKKAIQLRQARRNARPASIARGVSSTEMITEHKTRQWKRSPRTKKKKNKNKNKKRGWAILRAPLAAMSPAQAPRQRLAARAECTIVVIVIIVVAIISTTVISVSRSQETTLGPSEGCATQARHPKRIEGHLYGWKRILFEKYINPQ